MHRIYNFFHQENQLMSKFFYRIRFFACEISSYITDGPCWQKSFVSASSLSCSFYRPQMKFGARQCFYTCLSVHWAGLHPGVSAWGVCIQGSLPRWSAFGGAWVDPLGSVSGGRFGQTPPPELEKTGGMHPTGMLSCCYCGLWIKSARRTKNR